MSTNVDKYVFLDNGDNGGAGALPGSRFPGLVTIFFIHGMISVQLNETVSRARCMNLADAIEPILVGGQEARPCRRER